MQGTLYPDIVESGGGDNAVIKSHHNVGGLPEDMDFELVEPLRHLFKDEVRAVGEELGLPEEIVWRQPFPGPGSGCGSSARSRRSGSRSCSRPTRSSSRRSAGPASTGRSGRASRCCPRCGPSACMGDDRTYAYPIIIRAVTSDDAMTADWARLPYEVLERISSRVINEVPGVNRVAYDVTSQAPRHHRVGVARHLLRSSDPVV